MVCPTWFSGVWDLAATFIYWQYKRCEEEKRGRSIRASVCHIQLGEEKSAFLLLAQEASYAGRVGGVCQVLICLVRYVFQMHCYQIWLASWNDCRNMMTRQSQTHRKVSGVTNRIHVQMTTRSANSFPFLISDVCGKLLYRRDHPNNNVWLNTP